jgi:hypothetical protein
MMDAVNFGKLIDIEYGNKEIFDVSNLETKNNFEISFITIDNFIILGNKKQTDSSSFSTQIKSSISQPLELCFNVVFDDKIDSSKILCFDFVIELSVDTIDCSEYKDSYNVEYIVEIEIYYFDDNRKVKVLSDTIFDFYANNMIFNIQKIDKYFFFSLNNQYLGCTLRSMHEYYEYDHIPFSFITDKINSLIKIGNFSVTEILKHGLYSLNGKVSDFKTDQLFYVSIQKRVIPDDEGYYFSYTIEQIEEKHTIIKKLNESSVETNYKQSIDTYYLLVVTNDYEVINKYRNSIEAHVLSDLKRVYEMHYIGLVLFNLCRQCKTFNLYENWSDSDTGHSYSFCTKSGWFISN